MTLVLHLFGQVFTSPFVRGASRSVRSTRRRHCSRILWLRASSLAVTCVTREELDPLFCIPISSAVSPYLFLMLRSQPFSSRSSTTGLLYSAALWSAVYPCESELSGTCAISARVSWEEETHPVADFVDFDVVPCEEHLHDRCVTFPRCRNEWSAEIDLHALQ